MENSYLMMPRGVLESDIFTGNHTLSEDMAYLYFFYKAAFADHIVEWNGYSLILKRGQLATSYRNLKKELRWSQDHIASFLKKLEEYGKITVTEPIGFTVITLHDYVQNRNNDSSTGGHHVNYPDHFNKFFTNYKQRKQKTNEGSKKKAFDQYQQIIKSGEATPEDIFNTSQVYLDNCNKGQKQFTQAVFRWLKDASFDDKAPDPEDDIEKILSKFKNKVN